MWDSFLTKTSEAAQRVLLRGPPGSGKSVLMAATVERLRQAGWSASPCSLPVTLPGTHRPGHEPCSFCGAAVCCAFVLTLVWLWLCRLVMYVPDCQDVTHRNMFYSRNESTGMFDTRDSARNILRSMLVSHGEQLKGMPQQLSDASGTLFDLVNQPEAAADVRFH